MVNQMNRNLVTIICFIVIVIAVDVSSCQAQVSKSNAPMIDTMKYLETLEWDVDFLAKSQQLSIHRNYYVSKLTSGDPEKVYAASVMLGLLRDEGAISIIEKVGLSSPKARIGLLFAFCMLKRECTSQKKELMRLGEETSIAGQAVSLVNIEVVELLSLLKDDKFIDYALKLRKMSGEVWQHDAIDVAIERNKQLRTQ
jgi:hypothetical protein